MDIEEYDLLFGESIETRFARFKTFMLTHVKDESGEPVEVKDHQIKWFYAIEMHMYILILAPREHGKSTIDKGYILWRLCEDNDLRVLIGAHKQELSHEFARFIQSYLELPEIQAEYGVAKGTPWRVGEAYFRSQPDRVFSHPFMTTVAMKAGVTGKRFDIIIMDDPFEDDDVDTEKKRRVGERWINKALYPALDHVKKGRPVKRKWIVLGTRKNVEDWYSKLLQMPQWYCIRDQLYTINEAGEKEYLWPEKFNEQVEAELRAQMEPDEFAMEYMNEPIAEEGLRLKREWIEPNFYVGRPDVPDRHLTYYMGIDPSVGSKKDRASYAAIAVIAFDDRPIKQDIYVVDLIRSKLSLAEQEDIIQATYKKWTVKRDGVNVEPTAVMENVMVNKTFADRMLRLLPSIRTVDYIHSGLRGTSDVSKIGRIENVFAWLCKRGKVYLQDPTVYPMSKILVDEEYVQFPEGRMDLLDALTLACDRVDLRKTIDKFKVWMY